MAGLPHYVGFSNGFINPSSAEVFSSPDESGVTSKTPRKPHPQGKEGVRTWIYWDVNDGSGELYRALTPNGLTNPITCIREYWPRARG